MFLKKIVSIVVPLLPIWFFFSDAIGSSQFFLIEFSRVLLNGV